MKQILITLLIAILYVGCMQYSGSYRKTDAKVIYLTNPNDPSKVKWDTLAVIMNNDTFWYEKHRGGIFYRKIPKPIRSKK